MPSCKLCGKDLPYSGQCPRCFPMYQRDISTGHIWPTLKTAGVTPSYSEWNQIREVEVGYAKALEIAQNDYEIAVKARMSAAKQAYRKQRIEKLKETLPKSVTEEIEKILRDRATSQASKQPQRDGTKDYLDSTYSF